MVTRAFREIAGAAEDLEAGWITIVLEATIESQATCIAGSVGSVMSCTSV
jgi:hypothetical protein